MPPALCPGTRQWDLIVLVARYGPITLAEIARRLGLARTSIQHQVGRLLAEGWLERTRRRGRPGRPADVFSLSEQSRRLFAQQSGGITRNLLEEIAETEGESRLRALVRGVGRRMVRRFRPKVGKGTPRERAERLTESLRDEGVLSDVNRSPTGLKLTIHTCPYHGLSQEHGVFCEMDREMVSQLVGAKTRVNRRIAGGHPRCEFELAVAPDDETKRSREYHDGGNH